ncbi:unnamed protein product [Prorocentrum cordatum]|uniref:Calmodulin n=1 Tax=Prorocentrum cordatum TaxID=2364126 RepID=A0ABN9QRJ8_9DINO|nr:unnamed protein product [Polarella glacialis]
MFEESMETILGWPASSQCRRSGGAPEEREPEAAERRAAGGVRQAVRRDLQRAVRARPVPRQVVQRAPRLAHQGLLPHDRAGARRTRFFAPPSHASEGVPEGPAHPAEDSPFSKLTQKQAEAVIAELSSREDHGASNRFGWSFAPEMDDFSRLLPFMVMAYNAIDRDSDEIVSREEFDEWLEKPTLEHQTEGTKYSSERLEVVEASLPGYCKRGLDGPDGLVSKMRRARALHFEEGERSSMSLRDFTHLMMKVTVEGRRPAQPQPPPPEAEPQAAAAAAAA